MLNAHRLLGLAALRAEASNCGAFLGLGTSIWVVVDETHGGLLLQFVGQVMEDACTVLQRLKNRREFTLKVLFSYFCLL